MPIVDFEPKKEMDEEFEHIEELNMEWLSLRQAFEDAENEVEYAQKQLASFQEDNAEYVFQG